MKICGLRTPAPLSAACLFGLISPIAACTLKADRFACGGRDALLQAVFEQQFTNNHSSIGQNAVVYFIGLEHGSDPDTDFLQRFDGQQPRVEPLSMAGRTNHRVIDLRTGRPALIFEVRKITESENNSALIETGYYEAELSASWNTLLGICEGGEWLIELISPEILS
jgi:hypothetical protein